MILQQFIQEETAVAAYRQLSDHELILQCQDGAHPSKLLFAELVHRYQPYVEKALYQLEPRSSDRADLSQEVWIRVYRRIKGLREPIKFRFWLSRIISNLFYNELRKRRRNHLFLAADCSVFSSDFVSSFVSPAPGPLDELITQELFDQFQGAIASLPESFRTTIVMREIQDLPYQEIAELTGVSLGTVKSRVFRARQSIQEQLSAYFSN